MFDKLSACSRCGLPIQNHTRRTKPKIYCDRCLTERKKEAVKLFMLRRKKNAY